MQVPALFERALGDAWSELDHHIRDRYGLVASEDRVAVGTGVMDEIGSGLLVTPVLWLGTADDFLFPESGTDVPFSMRSVPFVDANGYEGLLLERDFETDPPRTFVDTVRWNPNRGCLTDLLGRSGRVVSDLHLSVDERSLVLRLGRQWLRAGDRYVPIPGPLAVDGELRDWYNDRFEVSATIENVTGTVFEYRGQFENTFRGMDRDAGPPLLADVPLPGER